MKKIKHIKQCLHHCPFYENTMDGMNCGHPYWNNKGAYESMIINTSNSSNGKIPEKCPLRKESLEIIYKL